MITSPSAFDLAAFARAYEFRGQQISWLFGAGASASAGIPTAGQATWDWKASIFATETKVSLTGLDLSDPFVRRRIQRHFDAQGGCPAEDAEAEYGYYFERAYPRAQDRRAYIERLSAKGKPGYGHTALAALMKLGKIGVIWTTNFDHLIEDAAAQTLGTTGALAVASLSDADVATGALRDARYPLLVKLHGDFQSDHLKNIPSELQTQDATLRQALSHGVSRFGLAVVGYSGRDASVMDALRDGLNLPKPYPSGLYWFVRQTDTPLPAVENLIVEARAKGVDAQIVRFGTFDELFGVVLTPFALPAEIVAGLAALVPPARSAPFVLPATTGRFPVLRLNALLVDRFPTTARRIECQIGGTGEVKQALRTANSTAVAQRRNDGVIAFGPDEELRRVFGPLNIRSFDIAPLDPLGGRSSDVGLLYDAIAPALVRGKPLIRRTDRLIAVDPAKTSDASLAALKSAAGSLGGNITGANVPWAEAVEVRLEVRLGKLWLVLGPTLWAPRPTEERLKEARQGFFTKRLGDRHNAQANAILGAWADLLGTGLVSSYGISPAEGIDASFELSSTTAYSLWRG